MGEREKRGGRGTEEKRDAPFVCALLCHGLPWGRERGLITLEMSCVFDGEGSSFAAGSKAGIHECILTWR